jgi:acylpyruvate hydrolase
LRFVTLRSEHGTSAGRIEGQDVVELDARDVREVLERMSEHVSVGETGHVLSRDAVDLAPVVPHPRKIICVGLNYRAHILEMGRDVPTAPTLFAKFDRALIGATDDIVLPEESAQVDWEVELVLVIGRSVRRANRDEAAAAIAGYTVGNDISMRDWQWRTPEWLQGKTFESSTPIGPELVTADELSVEDLEVLCEVDGQVMQRSRTSDLVFSPVDLVAYASTIITLDPGDVIMTGTPGGVGGARNPPIFLKSGSQVRTTIEGIGSLVNRCVS